MIDRSQNNLGITQILCLHMCDFIYKKHQVTAANHIHLNLAVSTPNAHTSSISYLTAPLSDQPPPLTAGVTMISLSHTRPYTQITNLLKAPPTSKQQVFFKISCHVCCIIYLLLNHLACIKCLYIYIYFYTYYTL